VIFTVVKQRGREKFLDSNAERTRPRYVGGDEGGDDSGILPTRQAG